MSRSRKGVRVAVPALAAGTSAVLVAAGCSRHATPAECLSLLDRYVDLSDHADNPQVSEEQVREDEQRSRAKAAVTPSFAECPREVTRDELECAMKAPNADELEKCLDE